jgi:hypothetical protein
MEGSDAKKYLTLTAGFSARYAEGFLDQYFSEPLVVAPGQSEEIFLKLRRKLGQIIDAELLFQIGYFISIHLKPVCTEMLMLVRFELLAQGVKFVR